MKLIAISYGKKIAKFIATGYLITIKIALVMRIQAILLDIIHFFKKSHRNYGSPRIYKDLKAGNTLCSLNKVARMMREHGIYSKLSIKHKRVKIPRNNTGFASNILDR